MSGRTVLVSREFHFDAAHFLPDYQGRCEKLHGHRWRARITVKARVDPATGIALDFLEIDRIAREAVMDQLDHALLNDLLPQPSAENLAFLIWERLEGRLPLYQVEIWETPRNKVSYRPDL